MIAGDTPASRLQDVLLIQADGAESHAFRATLAAWIDDDFQVAWVGSCAAALGWLADHAQRNANTNALRPAIVVDLLLPDVQGLEAYARLQRAAPRVPILVLCRRQDEALARLAVQNGAQDYLLKDRLDTELLGKALASMIQRAALADARERQEQSARVTLDSIGDAIVSSNACGEVTYLNGAAESMTGWSLAEASGHPVDEVLHLIDATSRETVASPMAQALREDRTVALTSNCVLTRRDGCEMFIEDSSAPIHSPEGQVSGAVMVFRDVNAVRAQSRNMAFLAQHDSLTDLPNRLLLQDRFTQALTLAERHPHRTVALLFVDLDGFKGINDTLGHAVGDQLLISVARRLQSCVRSADTVSRLGGDEFVILLPELLHARDATAIADKVLRVLGAPHPILDQLVRITASIGIATLPEGEADARVLLERADLAMYHAKASGRNNYQFFEPALQEQALDRDEPARQMRSA